MHKPILDIRHLEMMVALADTPRMIEAAESLNITPSALSHRLREVERRLEMPLFMRVRKRLQPTPAADYLAQVARRLLADMARAEEDVRKMARGVGHVVRLAVESYSAYHWLPGFLQHLRHSEPDVGIEVAAAAARTTLASLHAGDVDLIVVSGAINRSGLDLFPLFEDELCFVMSPEHRLASRVAISSARISSPIRGYPNRTVNTRACFARAIPIPTGSKPSKSRRRSSKWSPPVSVSRYWPAGRYATRWMTDASWPRGRARMAS